MPTTPTANFGWVRPSPNGDNGAWGGELNATLQAIDTEVKGVKTTAVGALPLAGGVMTGRADLKTATLAISTVDGSAPLDLAVANYFKITPAGAAAISFANVPAGVATFVVLHFVNALGKGVTFSGVKWGFGSNFTNPTLTNDDLVLIWTDDAGYTWRGVVVEQSFL